MKLLKFTLISVLALPVVLLIAAAIFLKTFDVNRFKPQIIAGANKALNRQVNFEKANLAFSFSRGINLKINDLAISEDPSFATGGFFTVKEVSLAVDALAYLFHKKVSVPSVAIDAARITVIRKKDGTFNLSSIAQSPQSQNDNQKPQTPPPALALPAILINSVKGDNCQVLFIDQSYEPPMRLEISSLSFSLSALSLTEAFPFTVEAAVLGDKKNISIQGKLRLDLKSNEVEVIGLKASSELSAINLSRIPESLPMAKGISLPTSLQGRVDVSVDKLVAGAKGLSGFTADATLSNGLVQFKEMVSPIKNLIMQAKITEKNLVVEKVSAGIGQGSIEAKVTIDDYLAKQDYRVEADVKNIKLQDLVSPDKAPVKPEGILSTKIKAQGTGFTPESLQSNLTGNAEVAIVQAKLKDINVLRTVLDKISVIPMLSEKIESGLPEKYAQKLKQPDTVLSDMQLPITLQNGKLILSKAAVGSDEFMFKGDGQAGFDGSYLIEGSFVIPQELSASMVDSVSELQYLLNDSKEISVPLKVSGKAGELALNVDAEYIAKRLLTQQAQQQIFKAIDKYLGPKEKSEPAAEGSQPTQEGSIGGILDKLLR